MRTSEDGSSASCLQRSRAERKVAGRRHGDDEGDEWFRQGSGTARVSLRAGSHQELGIVLAWELAPRPTSVEQARLALQRSRLAWWLAMSLVAWLLARSGSSCLARGLQNLNFGNMGRPE